MYALCMPVVTTAWIETDDNLTPPALIPRESVTCCDAGGGIIRALTSGQSPGEGLDRDVKIEWIADFLRHLNETGTGIAGGGPRVLTDAELRQFAADYVDVMRALSAAQDGNGFVDIFSLDPSIQNAFARLAGAHGTDSGYDVNFAINNLEASLMRSGQGARFQFSMVDSGMILGLTLDRAVPNSTMRDLLIAGGVTGVLTAPLWAPAAGGLVTTGAASAMPYINALLIGGAVFWDQIKNAAAKGAQHANALLHTLSQVDPKVLERIGYGTVSGLNEAITNENATPQSVANAAIAGGLGKTFGVESEVIKEGGAQAGAGLRDGWERLQGLGDGGASAPEN